MFLDTCLLFGMLVYMWIFTHMQSFVGHGDSINEIRTQMLKPSLVLSASKVRIMTFVLISISRPFECLLNTSHKCHVQYLGIGWICSAMECPYWNMHSNICWSWRTSKWSLECGIVGNATTSSLNKFEIHISPLLNWYIALWDIFWLTYGLVLLFQDFHPSDIYRIASCGMDNTVKIWSMKG